MGNFMIRIALLTKYYSGYQIKNNEMGGTCGTYERKVGGLQGFGGETYGGKKPLRKPVWDDLFDQS